MTFARKDAIRQGVARCFFVAFLLTQVAVAEEAILTGFDALTRPGDEVVLLAKLEKAGLTRSDIEGEEIDFFLDELFLGSSTTGDDGTAGITTSQTIPGEHSVTVSLAKGSKYMAKPDTLLLAVWDKSTRIFVCDLDHTLADVNGLQFLRRQNKDIPTLPGAPGALQKLDEIYNIVYVTGRDDIFTRKTNSWLQANLFPVGPVFYWDFLGGPFSHGKFKRNLIAEFKKSFARIEAGAGDLATDASAYLENGIQAFILIGKEHDEDLPKEAKQVESWKEIVEQLTVATEADDRSFPNGDEK